MSYFSENSRRLKPLEFDSGASYRACQRGACLAALAHFTTTEEPALISMPTGSGKTAVMMMLAFLLNAEHVVIVNPFIILKDQTFERFRSLKDLKSIGAYPQNGPNPRVLNHTGRITTPAAWREFLEYDVVVTTPQSISPGHEGVIRPPRRLFDEKTLFIFDEGHHSAARTWRDLMNVFSSCRRILLTATPFRNDNRSLGADLIYHYPIEKALEEKIYSSVRYHEVRPDHPTETDQELCQQAVTVYRRHKRRHPDARLLIRAEGVTASHRLLDMYREAGLNVEEVNYRQSLVENRDALQKVRTGEIDGVVCIGMVGEGIDIPNLKIAVLHRPAQSFPATVQFIGRICRESTTNVGEPQLIACPDAVAGQLQRLYRDDPSWDKMIPALVEKVIDETVRRSRFHAGAYADSQLNLNPEDIEIFFSTRIYHSNAESDLEMKESFILRGDLVPAFVEIVDETMLVVVTVIKQGVPWAKYSSLSSEHYDLHVFYFQRENQLLFEYSSSDKIAGLIRESLWENKLVRLSASEISGALSQTSFSRYLMFGLSSLNRGTRSIPSYKTYMGSQVENAVRPTDARSFTPGHALARYADGETRGIGSFQGRVWAIKRAPLSEFRDWCDQIAQSIFEGRDNRLPNVAFLSAPTRIREFPDSPVAVVSSLDPRTIVRLIRAGQRLLVNEISFEQLTLSDNKQELLGVVCFSIEDSVDNVHLRYSLSDMIWHFEDQFVEIDNGTDRRVISLSELFDKYQPLIILKNGDSVRAGDLFSPAAELSSLPESCLDVRDWSLCDIYSECGESSSPFDSMSDGLRTVHGQLYDWLSGTSNDSIVVYDHGSGEIADFVEINISSKNIRYYHCKACSARSAAGARIADLKDALQQSLRSVNEVGNNELISEIMSHVETRERSTVLIEGASSLEGLADSFQGNEWQYEIVIVNLGISCGRVTRSRNTNTLLLACYEWTSSVGASFRLIGQ
jgi:superfamily II DNA or RNA helicase